MRKVIGLFGGIIPTIVITLGTGAVSVIVVKQSVSAQVHAVAFTAVQQEIVYKADGSEYRRETHTLARQRNGSTVRVRSLATPGGGGAVEQRQVVDLDRREQIYIDGLTNSLTTYPMTQRLTDYRRRFPQCTPPEDPAAKRTILGYEAYRFLSTSSEPGRVVRYEEWRAPALACLTLLQTVFVGNTESELRVANVQTVLQVTEGEPAPSLFAVPTGYQERSPTARRNEFNTRYRIPETANPQCLREGEKQADERYYDRQGSRGK
jgi:hypothetical protein